jgi:hypothetical protein
MTQAKDDLAEALYQHCGTLLCKGSKTCMDNCWCEEADVLWTVGMEVVEPPTWSQLSFAAAYGEIQCKANGSCNNSCCCAAFGVVDDAVDYNMEHGSLAVDYDIEHGSLRVPTSRAQSSGSSRRSSIGSGGDSGGRFRGITSARPRTTPLESRAYEGTTRVHGSSRPPPGKHAFNRIQFSEVRKNLGGISRGGKTCCVGQSCVDYIDDDAVLRLRHKLYYDGENVAGSQRVREKILKNMNDNSEMTSAGKVLR